MIFAIPVAWLQLIHQRVRFVGTLAGIAFVVVLLFMQVGLREALFDSSVQVHKSLHGDLFLISPQYKSITSQQSFSRERLLQTLGHEEVDSINPLYVQFGKLKNFQTGQKSPIFVFGIDPGERSFNLSGVNQNIDQLKLADRALFDEGSRIEFGPIADTFRKEGKVEIEISPYNEINKARKLEVRGLFKIGTSFGVDGNLIINDSTFLNLFTERNARKIDIGLINLRPGANINAVKFDLVNNIFRRNNDVRVLTLDEFVEMEKAYWDLRTPAGFAFKVMVTMGFIIGTGIVYQILYSNISTHLIEFATLKAIGHTSKYLLGIVFQQALMLAFLGYIPGIIISVWVYNLTQNATKLPIEMNLDRIILVLVSVVLMCMLSGSIAINKLRSVDPADIF
jgi:putative ABC transport system permease protein